jgi:Ca2+-binding EF-hand superfamily protein
MEKLRLQFENQLRTKLSQKASVHHTEAQTLHDAFRYFDLDNSGAVSLGEWRQVCQRLNVSLPRDAAEQLFNYYDFDGSGDLDYREFSALLLGKSQGQVESQDVYAQNGSGGVIGMPGKLSSRGRPESPTDQHLTTTYEPPVTTEAPPSVRGVNASKALDSFRRKLLDRGVCGLMQLTEAFRGFDRDSSHTLSLTEFSAACSDLTLGLSAVETRALFKHFDTDN